MLSNLRVYQHVIAACNLKTKPEIDWVCFFSQLSHHSSFLLWFSVGRIYAASYPTGQWDVRRGFSVPAIHYGKSLPHVATFPRMYNT